MFFYRRFGALLTALMLLFTASFGASAMAEAEVTNDFEETCIIELSNVGNFAVMNDTLYATSPYTGVFALKDDKWVCTPVLCDEVRSCNMIAAYGDTMYILTLEAGNCKAETAALVDGALTLNGDVYPFDLGFAQGEYITCTGVAADADNLWLLIRDESRMYGDSLLYRLNFATGELNALSTAHLLELCSYKDGLVLAQYWDNVNAYSGDKVILPTLVTVDKDGNLVDTICSMGSTNSSGLCYDAKTDIAYATDGIKLYQLTDAGAEHCAYIYSQYSDLKAGVVNGRYYIANNDFESTDGPVISTTTDPSLLPDSALRIAAWYMDTLLLDFTRAHPEIPLELVDPTIYGAEAISQSMLTGQDSADVYIISLTNSNFAAMRDKGYCVDLSDSRLLMDRVNAMYPNMIGEVMKDGHLYALPCSVSIEGIGYSPSVMEMLGLTEADMPRTMMELMDFAVNWAEEYADDYPDLQLFMNVNNIREQLFYFIEKTYVSYYAAIGEPLTFDTPLMQKLLEKLDEVSPVLETLNPDEEESGGMIIIGSADTPDALFQFYNDVSPQLYMSWNYATLPLALDDGLDPAFYANVSAYAVNPNSVNTDLAIPFLEFIVQNCDAPTGIALCPDVNQPVESSWYASNAETLQEMLDNLTTQLETADESEKADLETQIDCLNQSVASNEANRYRISAEDIAAYRELAPYVVASPDAYIFMADSADTSSLNSRYLDGQMTAVQYIKEYDRIIQMIRMENE